MSAKVRYKKSAPARVAKEEHNETIFQNADIKKGNLNPHPAIAEAIHTFANNPKSFTSALKSSSIEPLTNGMNIQNTDFGKGTKGINPKKQSRVSKMLKSDTPIDRPIVLRYTNNLGRQFNHLLTGNTRATNVGEGIQAHIIDVGKK
jgi:hypothetical protein